MLDMNALMKRLKNRIPDPVFRAVDKRWYYDILIEESLPTYSIYYPKRSRLWRIGRNNQLNVTDSKGALHRYIKYAVPLEDDKYPYIGVAAFYHYSNGNNGVTFRAPGMIDGMINNVLNAIGNTNAVNVTCDFEGPNIITLEGLESRLQYHTNFVVSMYRTRRLNEIKSGYHEWFKQLFEYDCKIALYNKFYQAVDGGVHGGIELKDYVSRFADAEDKRESLIEDKFGKDWFLDADRHEEIFAITEPIP
jgi:hypothetical protein